MQVQLNQFHKFKWKPLFYHTPHIGQITGGSVIWPMCNLTNYVETFLSKFISTYHKSYSSNHVLICLIKNWKKFLDQKKFVGAVLMVLSKAFDSIPHNLSIAKMHAYGFSIDAVTFFYLYLKRCKQNVRINNTFSVFQILLSEVPESSILGLLLFNIYIY